MPYFDVHTHTAKPNGIVNCYPEAEIPESYFSIGIHPWYISDLNEQLHLLEEKAKHNNCLAIGECGLDSFSEVDIKLQKIAFRQQIQLANQLKKPLIIHLVIAIFTLFLLHLLLYFCFIFASFFCFILLYLKKRQN